MARKSKNLYGSIKMESTLKFEKIIILERKMGPQFG